MDFSREITNIQKYVLYHSPACINVESVLNATRKRAERERSREQFKQVGAVKNMQNSFYQIEVAR